MADAPTQDGRAPKSSSPSPARQPAGDASPAKDNGAAEAPSEGQPPLPDEEAPPLPEEEAPPLPDEAPPDAADDGWEPCWDNTAQAWYFYNNRTGLSQWNNPRVPETNATSHAPYARFANYHCLLHLSPA
jgi:hypothetical protein